jgi:homoserine kinase type II
MVTILAWCFGDDLEPGPASAMARAYLATMKPTAEEGEAFRRDLYPQAIFACARFATTRITDFELRPKGTGIYKDFRRFLARMDTIERLGPEGLLTIL